MSYLKIKNRAISTLASDITDVATSLTVATGEGAKFDDTGDFHITIEASPTVFEIVKCTARSGDVLTIVRPQEGTDAIAHSAGEAVELRITAGVLESRTTWTANKLLKGAGAGVPPTEIIPGTLAATCVVVASNAKAEIKTWATILQAAGYPVWVCDETDDNVQIQAAIDALPTYGGKVVLSEGTFSVSAAINILKSSVYIEGQGREATIVSTTSATLDVFVVGDGTNWYYEGCISELSIKTSVTRTAGCAIKLQKISRYDVRDVFIRHPFVGVKIDASVVIKLDHVRVYTLSTASDSAGVWILGTSSNEIKLTTCDIINEAATAGTYGILVNEVDGLYLSDIAITSYTVGLRLRPLNGKIVGNLFATNLMIDGVLMTGTVYAIQVAPEATGKALSLFFTQCWAVSYLTSGVALEATGTIDGVRFIALRCRNNGTNGMVIGGGTNIRISDSSISNNSATTPNTYHGIAMAAAISGFSIVNCRIGTEDGASASQNYGIALFGGETNYIIAGNDLRNNVGTIYNATPSETKIIIGNIGYGIVDARCAYTVDDTYGADEAGVLDALRDAMITLGLIRAA